MRGAIVTKVGQEPPSPTESGATVKGSTHTSEASGAGPHGAPRGAFELAVVEPGTAERLHRVEAAFFSIGSHPSNGLQLRDPAVSRFHCEVRCEGDAVLI